MTSYLLKKQESTIVARGVAGLYDAERVVVNDFSEKVFAASREAYITITDIVYDEGVNITEEEATELYRKIALKKLKDKYKELSPASGDESMQLVQSFETILPQVKTGDLSISKESNPQLELNGDTIYLKNVLVSFTYGNTYYNEKGFETSAKLEDIVLYDENEDLFNCSMVSGKGIYITGKTSTIIGNIYAGTHGPSELRKAEALYGESDSYGGINIMSTQVAIEADKIVTDGNINLKGAFTVFGSEDRHTEIYARDIIENDNIANKNIYALFGELSTDDISSRKTVVAEAMRYLGSIEHYYDTENDKSYHGKYRKIISQADVTVTSDVTGVIITPGSVIIEEGVNIEGLILSGDRIYIQGNNNIVSSVEIMREIIKEELYKNIYSDDEYDTDEERALNSIHLYMKDYIGGIKRRGFVSETEK